MFSAPIYIRKCQSKKANSNVITRKGAGWLNVGGIIYCARLMYHLRHLHPHPYQQSTNVPSLISSSSTNDRQPIFFMDNDPNTTTPQLGAGMKNTTINNMGGAQL